MDTQAHPQPRMRSCCTLGVAVVVCAFFCDALSIGARSFFPVVLETWEEHFGWSRSRVSGARALMYAVQGMTTPVAGHFMDVMDARTALVGALVLLSLALALTSLIKAEWQMWAVFGALGGAAFGSLNLNVFAAAITRFVPPRHRGTATGIATSGSTFGQFALVPLFALLVSSDADRGWRHGYQITGVASAVLALVSFRVLAPRAADGEGGSGEGTTQKGENGEQGQQREREPSAEAASVQDTAPPSPPVFLPASRKLRQLFYTRHFWALGFSFVICGITTTGFVESHIVALCTHRGHSTTDGALVFGIISAFNGLGIICAGRWCDYYSRTVLLAAIYGGRALAYVVLRWGASTRTELVLWGVLFGLVDYSVVPPTISLVETHFGAHMVGLGVGVLLLLHSLGAALGAWWGGVSFDGHGDYHAVLLAAVVLCSVAALLVLTIPEPWKRQHAKTEAPGGEESTCEGSESEKAPVVVRANALEGALHAPSSTL